MRKNGRKYSNEKILYNLLTIYAIIYINVYMFVLSRRNLQKGNGWHSRENSMIREKTARLLHCTREREKDREREIGEETE